MWEAAPLSCFTPFQVLCGSVRSLPLGKAVIVLVPTGRVGTLYPSSAPAGAPAAPGRSASPCCAAESARGGTLMSLPEGIATPLR